MGRRKLIDTEPKVIVFEDKFGTINDKDFEKINNLYNFKQINKDFFDYKRNKRVATRLKSILTGDFIYNFNLTWLKTELYATNSKTLLEIVKNDPTLFNIYDGYLAKKKSEKHYEALNSLTKDLSDDNEEFTESF